MQIQKKPINSKAVAHAKSHLPSEDFALRITETFKAVGDITRVKILYILIEESLCVRDIAILVGTSESAISHQLRILRDRRLVKSQRAGTTITYSVTDTHVKELFDQAVHHMEHVVGNIPDHTSEK